WPIFAGGADIARDDTLDLKRCLDIAIHNHPNINSAANTIRIIESREGQAKANYYPQLYLSSGYSRIGPATASLIRGTDPYDYYTGSINLNQTIFDFGKTATQVEIQRFNITSAKADFSDIINSIILNVKKAYYGLLQARRNADVALETVKQFQQHLERAKGFFEIGTKPKFDVTKAQVDLSNAKINLLKAQNAARISAITLKNTMGMPDAPDFNLQDNLSATFTEIKFTEALSLAYQNRPDLASVIAKREAAERNINLAGKGYFPVLSGTAGYGLSGSDFPLDRGWNAGATLTFPLFSGFSTKYQVAEARANLQVLKSNEELLRQSIISDVQQAYANLQEAKDEIAVAELIVVQAQDNYDLAQGRYATGVGNPIEITDALVSLNNAKYALNAALYGFKIAEATLQKTIGARE
ncbi:MAG TPA: TolC family protein, partial [Smithellaceae bacterium]|nr:TolC family protein [Smithellaceae bacterium]